MKFSGPDLSELNTCEDTFVPMAVTPTTVVFPDLWGGEAFRSRIEPLADELHLVVKKYGLTMRGIAVAFEDNQSAALFRLFYKGETETA